jgi:arginase family enzyme
MKEVRKRGLSAVFTEALSIVEKNTVGFGISIDLDGLDPEDAPGVGTPVAMGLSLSDLCVSLVSMKDKQNFLGAEITEFNPHHDENHKTEKAIYQLICAMK